MPVYFLPLGARRLCSSLPCPLFMCRVCYLVTRDNRRVEKVLFKKITPPSQRSLPRSVLGARHLPVCLPPQRAPGTDTELGNRLQAGRGPGRWEFLRERQPGPSGLGESRSASHPAASFGRGRFRLEEPGWGIPAAAAPRGEAGRWGTPGPGAGGAGGVLDPEMKPSAASATLG